MSAGHILLIDDNDALRTMARRILVTAGYDVQEAADGEVGLACYRQEPSDVVITDIVMDGMEGLETIRALRQRDPAVKIIAMSGAGHGRQGHYLDLAMKLGARRILHKPFTADELLTAVTAVLAA